MRLLYAVTTLATAFGGTAKAAVEIAEAVARRGHDVTLYATDYGGQTVSLEGARAAGVDIEIFPVQAPRLWCRSRPMAQALKRAVPSMDVVHMQSLYYHYCWVVGALCREFGVPYIIRTHGSLDPYFARRRRLQKSILNVLFQNSVLRNATAIHYTTEQEKRLSEPYALGTPGVVVPLGVNRTDYAKRPARGAFRARYPEIGERRIVLFLGRLNYKKGLDILIPAFARTARAHSDIHLVLAGPDEDMAAKIRGWSADHGVSDRITFAGMLTGVDKLAALGDAEILVLPSYSDNFGIVVVEAMACGLPVLISDKVGIWPQVLEDGAGRVAPCDPAAFGEAMTALLADRDGLMRMRAAGSAAVARRYDWPIIAQQLETLYRQLASRRGRR